MLQTIAKVGPLLDLYTADHPEWGVRETAEALGIPRSSAHALLTSLVETGLLTSTARGRYRLGWRIVELYESMRAGTDVRVHAAPVLRALNEQTGETTNLGVLERGEVLYLDKVTARRQVAVTGLRVGSRLEPHCSALGKVLLAYATADQLRPIMESGPLRRFTDRTITDPAVLAGELAEIRRTGIGQEHGEVVDDVSCFAAPVKDGYGTVIAAISVTGPSFRVDANSEQIRRAVRAAADEITRKVGQAESEPASGPIPADDPRSLSER